MSAGKQERYEIADVAVGIIQRMPGQVAGFRLVRIKPDVHQVQAWVMSARFRLPPAANDATVTP